MGGALWLSPSASILNELTQPGTLRSASNPELPWFWKSKSSSTVLILMLEQNAKFAARAVFPTPPLPLTNAIFRRVVVISLRSGSCAGEVGEHRSLTVV